MTSNLKFKRPAAALPFSLALGPALGLVTAPAGAAAETASPPDTTPPDPFIRARTRQDMDYVFKHGIQTTCGTEDDERPVTCRMTALRKGRVLATDTGSFDRPYNRYHFNLHLSAEDRNRIADVDPLFNCFTEVLRERALGDAQAVDDARARARLHAQGTEPPARLVAPREEHSHVHRPHHPV